MHIPFVVLEMRTNKTFVKSAAIFSRALLAVSALIFSASLQAQSANQQDDASAVGEVGLVLGRAFLVSADDSRQILTVGSKIRATDQIITEANGHVHVRFIDNALVSVRPNSQLEITSYSYNPQQPEKSSFKFDLIEGVTRAVSGEGAKAARSRFRLNTPIAAIGVRGTDFVVSATDQTTRALVNQGAIVLAPYSADCSADTLGPCAINAVELSDNSLQIVEIDGGTVSPRLIPATAEREANAMRQEVQLAITRPAEESEDPAVASDVYQENVSSIRVAERVAATLPEFTPVATLASSELQTNKLVWGRWTDAQGELERITVAQSEAREGRKVTVGNSDYILYRSEGPWSRVDAGLGPISFKLDSAQAFYSSDSGVVAMQVNSGKLDIDFDQSLFSTQLNLNHDLTGFVDFLASGSISDRGYFHSRSDTQRIAGAVSEDGTEAGYFFQQQLESGNIDGLTLWESK